MDTFHDTNQFHISRTGGSLYEQIKGTVRDPARYRMTSEETARKAQLLALFDRSDARGQDLLLAIAAIHATRYPKGA